MSKSLSKILLLLIILIVLSETNGSISIASFATVIGTMLCYLEAN